MFESFIPKKFCREYAKITNSSQLALFMATVLNLKPAIDVWIKKSKFGLFSRICKKYKLFVKPDLAIERHGDFDLKKEAIGGHTLTSTIGKGLPVEEAPTSASIHVFVSRSPKNLKLAFQSGWYPLVVNGRVFNKPYIDHIWFGRALGYPECCIKFFRRYNNWSRFSFLYEIFKNTKGRPNYLCNCLLKNTPYSYIFHMPCSFRCRKTARWVEKIRSAILKREPEYVRKIDEHLKLPLLVFYEKTIYAFEGKLEKRGNRLFYDSVYYVGGTPSYDFHGRDLEKGNNLFVKNYDVLVFRDRKLIKTIKFRPLHFPFLIQFYDK